MRLDIYLAKNNFTESRTKAQLAIEKRLVTVNNTIVDQFSYEVKDTDIIRLISNPLQFVSRGGDKLQKAVNEFGISLKGKTILDIGASTGGFTDCCLQNGASFVYAVDVGTNQLHPALHDHPNIKSIEQTNIRDLKARQLDNKKMDAIVIDVSFISIKNVLPPAVHFLGNEGMILALVKPQFETQGKKKFKGGIIRDKKIHTNVLEDVKSFAAELQLHFLDCIPTDVESNEHKNLEFMVLFKNAIITPDL